MQDFAAVSMSSGNLNLSVTISLIYLCPLWLHLGDCVKQVWQWISVHHSSELIIPSLGRVEELTVRPNCRSGLEDVQPSHEWIYVLSANPAYFCSETGISAPWYVTKLHKQVREEWKQVLHRRPNSFSNANPHSAVPCKDHMRVNDCTGRKSGTQCHGFLQGFTYQLIRTSENN